MKKRLFILLTVALLVASFAASAARLPSVAEALRAKAVTTKSITLKPAKPVLFIGSDGVGETIAIKAKAKPAAASQVFTWQSGNTAVATVDENGVITPVGLGSAKITCQATDEPSVTKTITAKVNKLKLKSIKMNESAITISPNAAVQIGYTITPSNAYFDNPKWSTSNANVATVDQNGLVTAKKIGKCVVTCKASGKSAKVRVNVNFSNYDVFYLSIGQQDYISASDLIGCKDDAKRFAATVEASSRFGGSASVKGSTLFDLTTAQLKQALNDLPKMGMDENDVTYFFYSGHGASFQGYEGAIAGVDFVKADMESTLIKISELRDYLNKVPGTVVIAVDACYAGNFITSKSLGRNYARDFVNAFIRGGRKSIVDGNELARKYKLIVGCRPEELTYLVGNGFGSVFTQCLTQAGGVSGIETGSIIIDSVMAGDANKDKMVTVKEIYDYAYQRILDYLKLYYGLEIDQHMMTWPMNDPYPIFSRL